MLKLLFVALFLINGTLQQEITEGECGGPSINYYSSGPPQQSVIDKAEYAGPPGKRGAPGQDGATGPKGEPGTPGQKGEMGPEGNCECDQSELQSKLQALEDQLASFVCSPPPTIDDPNIEVSITTSPILNSVATYSCRGKYVIIGDATITCKKNGDVASWTSFDPQPPSCKICKEGELMLGDNCFFVGPATSSSTTPQEASSMCSSSNDASHLAYVKTQSDLASMKAYLLAYSSQQGWRNSAMALGGTYDINSKYTITWEDGTSTATQLAWWYPCCNYPHSSELKVVLHQRSSSFGMINHPHYATTSNNYVLCQY